MSIKRSSPTQEKSVFKKKVKKDEPAVAMTGEAGEDAATLEKVETVETDAVATTSEAGCQALTEQLNAAQAEARENRDHYLRARADLDNFRKRAQREKEDLVKFSNETILRELLPVIDNLERALQHAATDGEKGLLQGVELTLGQFSKVLEKFNVVAIEPLGELFDSARHEAMGQIESADQPPNTIVQLLQKGYLLNDRLLRPALVLIAKAPAAPVASEE
jgi:molecular chaperone GrpE